MDDRSTPTLEFNISDNTSGVYSYSIRIGNYFSDNITSPFSLPELSDGIHTLELISFDNAGNRHVELIQIKIDLSQPVMDVNRSIYKWFKEDPGEIIDVDFHSGDGSPLTHAEYSINDVHFSFPDSIFDVILDSFTSNWGISWSQLEEGENTISIRTFDEVGHSSTRNIFIYKDTMRPVLKIKTKAGVITSSDIKIRWTADDFISGMDYALIKIDDAGYVNVDHNNEYHFTNLADGEHTITIRAVDNAGNIQEESIEIEVNTNIFSFSGPLYGAPTCGLFVLFLVILGVIFINRRRKKSSYAKLPFPREIEVQNTRLITKSSGTQVRLRGLDSRLKKNKSHKRVEHPTDNEDDLEDKNLLDEASIDKDISQNDENNEFEEGAYHDEFNETPFEDGDKDLNIGERDIPLDVVSDDDLLDEDHGIQTLLTIVESDNTDIDDLPLLIPIEDELEGRSF